MNTKSHSKILRSIDRVGHTAGGPWAPSGVVIDPNGPIPLDVHSIDGYRGPRQPSSVHACKHVVTTVCPLRASWRMPSYDGKSAMWGTIYTCPSLFTCYDPSIDVSELDAAMQDLRGEIPTDVLLPNFITELPEALSLHKQLLENVFSHGPKSWKDAGAAYAKSKGKSVANTHLLYQFGIKPLAGDLVTLWNLGDRVRKRIRNLSSLSSDSWTSWRRRVSISGSAFSSSWGGFWSIQVTDVQHDQSADMMLFARIKRARKVNPATEMAAGLIDASGFSQVGSVIWEAIPFSFVADWFYPCGRALSVLNQQAFEGCLANQQVGNQAHFTDVLKFYGYVPTSGTAWANSNVFEFAKATARFYRRSGGFPSTQTQSHFGLRQTLLSGSLVLQKI